MAGVSTDTGGRMKKTMAFQFQLSPPEETDASRDIESHAAQISRIISQNENDLCRLYIGLLRTHCLCRYPETPIVEGEYVGFEVFFALMETGRMIPSREDAEKYYPSRKLTFRFTAGVAQK